MRRGDPARGGVAATSYTTALFLSRPHRFGAWVETPTGARYVHVPTSGRMHELLVPGAEVLIRPPARPGKTAGALVLVRHQGFWVSVDAQEPTRFARQALTAGAFPALAGYRTVRPEVRYGQSRIDFLLEGGPPGAPPALVEVKSVTLVVGGEARFPDAPTRRGARHLGELAAAAAQGWRAAVLFLIQRADATHFAPNRAADPVFAAALQAAVLAGVEVYAFRLRVGPGGTELDAQVPTRIR